MSIAYLFDFGTSFRELLQDNKKPPVLRRAALANVWALGRVVRASWSEGSRHRRWPPFPDPTVPTYSSI